MRTDPDPGRWAVSRVVVVDGTITTAASRDRLGRVVANHYAPFVDGRPVLSWALVHLRGTLPLDLWKWRTTETQILPDLRPTMPLEHLSPTERGALRATLDDVLGPYACLDFDGAPLERDAFSRVALPRSTRWSEVVRRVLVHLGHTTSRPRPSLFEAHNTVWTDDFATDTAASWSPWSSSSWTHDAVNGERSVAWGNAGGPKGFRYSAHNAGSLNHEAQVSGRLVAPFRTRMGLPAVRMSAVQRDAYVLDVHTRFPAIDVHRCVNGVVTNILNVFAEPAGYAVDSEEWVTMRLAASGAVGANVLIHVWAKTETSTTKPTDPGWIGVDASPQWTYTDTAVDRLDDAVHADCGIVNTVNGSSSVADAKYDYFKLRAIADRGGVVDPTMAGSAVGAGLLSASLLTAITFAGSLAGLATVSASLSTAVSLAGSATGVGSLAGALVTEVGLAGAASGVSSLVGDLATGVALAGAAVGVGSLVGELATSVELVGAAVGSSALVGVLVDAGSSVLVGSAAGVSTLAGALVTGIGLAGLAAGIALVKGNLVVAPDTDDNAVRWPETMADVSLVELIETQAIAWLRADARMTALVGGRIYTTIPESVVYPYVLVEAFVSSPWNRFRGFGRVVTFQCRAQSQVRGDYEVHRIADRMTAVLEGRDVALPPAKRSLWSVDESSGPTYTDSEAGVLTYHRPLGVRVRVQV